MGALDFLKPINEYNVSDKIGAVRFLQLCDRKPTDCVSPGSQPGYAAASVTAATQEGSNAAGNLCAQDLIGARPILVGTNGKSKPPKLLRTFSQLYQEFLRWTELTRSTAKFRRFRPFRVPTNQGRALIVNG